MHYLIYQITNKINNKIYIGKHQTMCLDDGYMGSGTLIIKAIKKYGKENFSKEILFICENEIEMNNKEEDLVNLDFCKRDDTYNLREGGTGGFAHINHSDMKSEYYRRSRETIENKPAEEISEMNSKKSRKGEDNYWFGKDRSGDKNPRFGAVVNDDTRKKISLANKGKIRDEKAKEKMSLKQKELWANPEHREKMSNIKKEKGHRPPSPKGKLWWNNGEIVIRAYECPGEGWIRGRKIEGKVYGS